jgi:hypothetical protein
VEKVVILAFSYNFSFSLFFSNKEKIGKMEGEAFLYFSQIKKRLERWKERLFFIFSQIKKIDRKIEKLLR